MSKGVTVCKNCNNKHTGNFCNICGEKKILDSDFSLSTLLSEAFGTITNVDSKLIRTFKLMFQNPGRLSLKYISGIRVPYLKPFQVFLICNLIFFIFLSDTDFFRSPSKWIFNENVNFYGTNVMAKVESIMQTKNIPLEEVKSEYDRISSNLSKSLLVLLIPFIALVGLIFNRKLQFGKHLIFATHFFSQFLLATTLLYLITTNIPWANRWFFMIPVMLASLFYYVVSIRVFYNKSIITSVIFGILGLVIIVFFIEFYRSFINVLSLNLV